MNEDTDYTKWTVLREGDGGRHVHELQVALMQKGFWPGEDDMLWWQFGDATCSAVQTFQVSYLFYTPSVSLRVLESLLLVVQCSVCLSDRPTDYACLNSVKALKQ